MKKIGEIGYWLAEEYIGKGLMTLAVGDLIAMGQKYYGLETFKIRVASQNKKSRAIPKRLGFKHSKTIENAERGSADRCYDQEIYSLVLKQ